MKKQKVWVRHGSDATEFSETDRYGFNEVEIEYPHDVDFIEIEDMMCFGNNDGNFLFLDGEDFDETVKEGEDAGYFLIGYATVEVV